MVRAYWHLAWRSKSDFEGFKPSGIDNVFLFLWMVFGFLDVLVEDRGGSWISIINSSNTVSPSSFDLSISSSNEHVISFEMVVFIQALFHHLYFLSLGFGASQHRNAWIRVVIDISVIAVQNLLSLHESIGLFFQLRQVLFSFNLKHVAWIGVLVFERPFVTQNL